MAWDRLGSLTTDDGAIGRHIDRILALPDIRVAALRRRKFHVIVDTVNGAGGLIAPRLLKELGCRVAELNTEPSGRFAHTPEPLPEHLVQLSRAVRKAKADIGFATDPDVDRLAVVDQWGVPLSEENTLALAVQFVLKRRTGQVVINMSTSRAVEDIARQHGARVVRTPVGEIHVARRMKRAHAAIGGEGNGGVIVPELHFGRDAPVGMALILQHLLDSGGTVRQMAAGLPQYAMIKRKVRIPRERMDLVERKLAAQFKGQRINRIDGLRVDFDDAWLHVRRSNTEPIVRIYTEARSQRKAIRLFGDTAGRVKDILASAPPVSERK
jgi:phosphomannomutase